MGEEETAWYKKLMIRALVESHIDDGEPRFYENYDTKKLVDLLVDVGVEVAYIHCCNMWGNLFYNTKVGHKNESLGDLNPVAEFVKEGHKRGIKVLGYFETHGCDVRQWSLHPEWRKIYQDGTTPSEKDLWKGVCPNSPYTDFLLQELEELVKNYDLDGLWLDNPWFHGDWTGPPKFSCYCKYCREKFLEEFGAEMPTEPDWDSRLWKQFILWRQRQSYNFLKRCRDLVKSIKPQMVFTFNNGDNSLRVPGPWSWVEPFSLAENADLADYLSCDFDHFPKGETLRRSLLMIYYRYLGRERPYDPMFSRSPPPFSWDPCVIKDSALMRTQVSLAIANGHAFTFYDQLKPDGTPYEEPWKRLKEVFSEAKAKKEWWVESEPIGFAAVIHSENSRTLYAKGNALKVIQNLFGVCKALLERHVPFGIINDRQLERWLSEFKVLVLPNVACMSDHQADLIREYVKNGGGLVATFETSLYNEMSEKRDNFLLTDLFGVIYLATSSYLHGKYPSIHPSPFPDEPFMLDFVQMKDKHPLFADISREMPLEHVGKHLKVKEKPGARVLGYMVKPYLRGGVSSQPLEVTDDPAIIVNEFGKGRVVYLPNRLDATNFILYEPRLRFLMANAVEWASGDRSPLEIDAPTFVEATLFKQPKKNRVIVHLVNNNPIPHEVFSVHNIRVRIKPPDGFKIKKVYLAPERKKASYTVEDGFVEILVPELEMHRMVIMEN